MLANCRVHESFYVPFVLRSSNAPSPAISPSFTVAAHTQQLLVGYLSSDQLSQIALYLVQNLGISGMPSGSKATALSATPGDSVLWIFDSGATHHMTSDSSTFT